MLDLHIERLWEIGFSGMRLPAVRKIVLNAHELAVNRNDPPLRRFGTLRP